MGMARGVQRPDYSKGNYCIQCGINVHGVWCPVCKYRTRSTPRCRKSKKARLELVARY